MGIISINSSLGSMSRSTPLEVQNSQPASAGNYKGEEGTQPLIPSLAPYGQSGHNDPLKDANGAPALEAPAVSFLDDELTAIMEDLQENAFGSQRKNAEAKIHANRTHMRAALANKKANLQESRKVEDDRKAADRKAKIWGWIGRIVAVVASIAAVAVTAATAGAASPLMAFAVMGLVGACISLADQIAKEKNPDSSISISALFNKIAGVILEKLGIDEQTSKRVGSILAGSMAVLTGAIIVEPQLAGDIAKGICELAGASETAKMAITMTVGLIAGIAIGFITGGLGGNTAAGMNKAVHMAISLGTKAIQGTTQIGAGVNALNQANLEADSANLRAEKKKIDALLVDIQNGQDESFEDLKNVLLMMEDSVDRFSAMIGDLCKNAIAITRNMNNAKVTI